MERDVYVCTFARLHVDTSRRGQLGTLHLHLSSNNCILNLLPSWSTSRLHQQGFLHLHLSPSTQRQRQRRLHCRSRGTTLVTAAYQTRLAQGFPKDMFKGTISGVNTVVHEGRGLNMTLASRCLAWGWRLSSAVGHRLHWTRCLDV